MLVTVKTGDTLWSIAKRELGDPQRWREIYAANAQTITRDQRIRGREHLKGPDWIFPGMRLNVG